jgi:transposase
MELAIRIVQDVDIHRFGFGPKKKKKNNRNRDNNNNNQDKKGNQEEFTHIG